MSKKNQEIKIVKYSLLQNINYSFLKHFSSVLNKLKV